MSHSSTRMRRNTTTTTGSLAAVGAVAALAYLSTLLGDFTFDDNFAVVTNGDVTHDDRPLSALFKHDFWGQDIASRQSHKSYRPLTILVFRLTRQAWGLLTGLGPPGLEQQLPRAPPALPALAAGRVEEPDGSRRTRPPGLHPFPFHVLAVVLHALVTSLVMALAQHLFALLEQQQQQPSADGSSQAADSAGGGRWLSWQVPRTGAYRAQAWVAALLFALHPIHTEAVAGVVGCAELICAAWSIPALLLYCQAVDGRYAGAQQRQQQQQKQQQEQVQDGVVDSSSSGSGSNSKQEQLVLLEAAAAGGGWQHWLLVAAAAGMAVCAALSKEIGITVIGTMLLYDALLAPHMQQQQQHRGTTSSSSSRDADHHQPGGASCRRACRRQMLRMLLLAVTALLYVRLRQWVAVEQLVAIYRKVENPIPFAGSRLTRLLTTGYLHARYAGLLLLPLHLSADWSFSCIPLVERLSDPRNAATLALYAYLAHTVLAAQPLGLVRQLWCAVRQAVLMQRPTATASKAAAVNAAAQGAGKATEGAHEQAAAAAAAAAARWRLFVLAGLLVAPFFPASNVLFYVGTFIGERLLYAPSIGFCLLAAELVGRALPQRPARGTAAVDAATDKQQQQQGQDGGSPSSSRHAAAGAGRWLVAGLVACVLVGYAGRTLLRCADWWDEERLFLSALRVCPNSAKVQQNMAVIMRRYRQHEQALQHLRRAQEIEPGYCEPSYWIGLCRMNSGDTVGGLADIEASLSCKYTAVEALQTLNQAYVMLHEAGRGADTAPMVKWAGVLASPHVLRLYDACATAEDAALMSALVGKSSHYVSEAVDVCLQGIQAWRVTNPQPDSLAGLTKQRHPALNTSLLEECVKLRHRVYSAFIGRTTGSRPVRRAVYRYISAVAQLHPGCRTQAGGGMPADVDDDDSSSSGSGKQQAKPTTHQVLINKVQSADAEDPWLQLEWGATLLAVDGGQQQRLQEAATHLEVASALFGHLSQALVARAQQRQDRQVMRGGPDGQMLASLMRVTALDGKTPLTALGALEGAIRAQETVRDAASQSTGAAASLELLCDALLKLCHARLQKVMLLRGQAGQAAVAEEGDARDCVRDIMHQRGCELQAETLRRSMKTQA